jgi:hypothetical protein
VANGRKVEVGGVLDDMANSWQSAMDVLAASAG